ncbi:MAG: formylglycine-generating enzyme family protein [Treponemataceae bacterium]
MQKMRVSSFVAAVAVLATVALASCASTADVLVNKEPGFFYGSGFDASQAAADEKAYLDLMYNVLTETNAIRQIKKSNFVLTAEIKDAFALLKLKPQLSEKKSDARYDVVYRLSREQWEKAETVRLQKLNKEFGTSFDALKGNTTKSISTKIKEAASLLAAIERSGAFNRIFGATPGGQILNARIEEYCLEITKGIVVTATPAGGLIPQGSGIVIAAADKGGKPVPAFPFTMLWKTDEKSSDPIKIVTDDKGKATVTVPADPVFKDRKVILSISADLSSILQGLPFLAKLDQPINAEFTYSNSTIGIGQGNAVKIQGGSFTIGAVKHDKRAGSVEKARKAAVTTFNIDRNLVTNADYKTYLDAINASSAEYPDYWENPDFNKPEQPVIGVSLAEAEKYAAWLSSVQGTKKRLPTEAEYEIAARAGKDVVFPWGDQLPSDGARATFSGSASATTAVGSRENGKNALGLADMAGNVWEWTTTAPAGTMSGNQNFRIVKGGSYLDGQYELRISNRVLRDPEDRHPDVGFRLVSEASNE